MKLVIQVLQEKWYVGVPPTVNATDTIFYRVSLESQALKAHLETRVQRYTHKVL